MNCPETARLLSPYVDSEIDLATSLAIEEHLQGCARCRATLDGLLATRTAIGRHCEFQPAPDSLGGSALRACAATRGEGRWRRLLRSPLVVAAPGLAALLLAGWLVLAGGLHGSAVPVSPHAKVVYHIASSDRAGAALRSLANHLQAAPDIKVVVVAHNDGVDFLLRGARDESDRPYEAIVKSFTGRGVEFRVCHNTLERRHLTSSQVIPEAKVIPSGIAEIGRLQRSEGYIYMRL